MDYDQYQYLKEVRGTNPEMLEHFENYTGRTLEESYKLGLFPWEG